MFKAFFYFFKECWKLNWKFPLFLMVNELVLGAASITNAVLPKFIIDAIFIAQDKKLAVIWVVAVLSVSVFLMLCRHFLYGQEFVQRNKTVQAYNLKFAKDLVNAKYEEIEKQSFLDKKAKALQYVGTTGENFAGVLRQAFSIFAQFVTLAGFACIIFTLSPIVIISIMASALLQAYLLDKTLKPIKTYTLEQSVVERRCSYFSEKLHDFQYRKEIRSYGLADWFLNLYKNQLFESFKFYKKNRNG